jgi:hypothetical protein
MSEMLEKHDLRKCCPDFDCSYGSWDRKTCRGCGADCSKCEWLNFTLLHDFLNPKIASKI